MMMVDQSPEIVQFMLFSHVVDNKTHFLQSPCVRNLLLIIIHFYKGRCGREILCVMSGIQRCSHSGVCSPSVEPELIGR